MRIHAIRPASCAALLVVASTALAGSEEFPPNTAQLKLFASMSGINASSFFDRYSTETCDDKDGEGRLATFNFVSKKEQSEFIPAGAKTYILGVGHVTPKAGEQVLKNVCRALASFTPEAGRTYEIRQDMTDRKCPIGIKDMTAGADAKAELQKTKGLCRKKI